MNRVIIDNYRNLSSNITGNVFGFLEDAHAITGCIASNLYIPDDVGLHVLDVGGGDGSFAAEVAKKYPGSYITIIEPGLEREDDPTKAELIADTHNKLEVKAETVQEFLRNNPGRKFDTIFVNKWNIYLEQRDDVILSLASLLREDGAIYISSVEKQRLGVIDSTYDEVLNLIPQLAKCFGTINCSVKECGNYCYVGYIVLHNPNKACSNLSFSSNLLHHQHKCTYPRMLFSETVREQESPPKLIHATKF